MSSIKKNNIQAYLSLQDTLLIKGCAICFMLWHHLFYEHPEYGSVVFITSQMGKVCVALFLFVSAYGLTKQYSTKDIYKFQMPSCSETFIFQAKRLFKLYVNYWIVFILCVPIGVFVFQRNLQIPYGEHVNIIKHVVLDLFGMQGFSSYNITWWFLQLIIVLYLLFPSLYLAIKKWNIYVLIVFFLLLGYHKITIPIVHDWLFPFAIGISFALNELKITVFLNQFSKFGLLCCIVLFMIVIAFMRSTLNRFGGIGMDGFFALSWILIVLTLLKKMKTISSVFQYLGKHSMNIFMVHTFIFYYFFSSFIYSFKFSFLIFIALLICSLGISILIEFIKKRIGIQKLINYINLLFDTKS